MKHNPWRHAVRLAKSRSGNVAVVTALVLPVLALIAGGAVDLSHADSVQTDLRDALDSATLAAVADGNDDRAKAFIDTQVGGRRDVLSWTEDFAFPESGRATGKATATLNAAFLGLIGMPTLTVRAEAEAVKDGGPPPCLTLLDPNASQALLVNSGAKLIAPNCEVHVRSKGSPAAVFNAGSKLDVARTCVAGARVLDNGGRPDRLETGCAAADDPFEGRLPTPSSASCTYSGGVRNAGPARFQPGVYCGGLNFNGAVNAVFEPGLYVIRGGDWNVNGGTWTGDGVTFYFEDSSRIQFNSGVRAELTAPTSGEYKNILFFEKPGLSRSAFLFNDTPGNTLDGVMYLPSRDMIYNSGSNARGDRLAMVFNTLTLNQTTWRLGPVTGLTGVSTPRLVR